MIYLYAIDSTLYSDCIDLTWFVEGLGVGRFIVYMSDSFRYHLYI